MRLAFRTGNELDRRGVRYHLPPASVYDADGYLRQELASSRKRHDYHANPEYGRLMMTQLLTELADDGPL